MSIQVLDRLAAANLTCDIEQKVVVTYLLGSLTDAGTERQALELIRNLDRRRFSVSVILLEAIGADRLFGLVDHCEIINTSQAGASKWVSRFPSLIRAVVRIRNCLSTWQTDVIHAFLPAPSILGGIGGRMAGVPVIIGSRRSLPSFYRANRGFFSSKADTVAFYLAHVTLGNSVAVTEEMKSFGCPPRRCQTILNGVDTARFHPHLSRTWRHEMGWGDDAIVVGMVANFRPCKRHCDFLQAAVILLRRHPDLRFVMMGADGSTRAEIQQKVHEFGVEGSVFVVDARPDPETILAAIDIYICTSESEGLSNVLLEALACGKPVIATRVGGNPEVVIDGENGVLVPVRSPTSIAAAAESLLSHASARFSMGRRGREYVESRFSLQRMVVEHEQLYRVLLDQHGYTRR